MKQKLLELKGDVDKGIKGFNNPRSLIDTYTAASECALFSNGCATLTSLSKCKRNEITEIYSLTTVESN